MVRHLGPQRWLEKAVNTGVHMTKFEKRMFRIMVGIGLSGFTLCSAMAYLLGAPAFAMVASVFAFIGIVIAFLWFIQACADSFRDYGLGEGTANLYGEDHAKRIFGENYMKPKQ